MTTEPWEQIKQLFHAALEHEPAQRPAFLERACGDDGPLRNEVQSLLASHDLADDFIETPASDVAAALLAEQQAELVAGQMVGHFKIADVLATGGMGEVYLADDPRLGRKVALKLLPPQFTADADRVCRFEQEARAASALNHPNIVTILEIGQTDSLHYIATEFIDGETLREHMMNTRMTLGEVLDVAVQVASALQAAHETGIVHRDIKPENIMLRRDRIVKVLDFGLAKLAPQQAAAVDAERASRAKTNPGVVMGTVGYMSPEQARALEVDTRTDVWSLGVVLYEMVSGRAPFVGETPSHVIVSILESEPPPLSLGVEMPTELERIISKALSKERARRYQTTGEMALDLKSLKEELEVEAKLNRRFQPNSIRKEFDPGSDGFGVIETIREPAASTAHIIPARPTASVEYLVGEIHRHKTFAGAALLICLSAIGLTYLAISRDKANLVARGKQSIAVLPLKPINAANRDEIYEIGIADSLIHRLSSMRGFVVRPLSATRKYAGLEQDPIAAGREQQVDYVLVANYQLASGKISITAQLFNVANGQIEESYKAEKDVRDVFAVQDAVAGEVGNLLQTRFVTTSSAQAAKRGTTNQEAYRLYLQGRNLTMKRNAADFKKAIEYFEQAVRLDPNYASAYAGLARAYLASGLLSSGVTRPAAEKAREAEKVREIINKALELDNNLAEAYVARANLELISEWDFAAVEKDLLRTIELEPNNDSAHWLYALLFAYRDRFDEAMVEIETAQTIDPGALMYQRDRGRFLYYARRYDEAIVQLKRVIDLDESFGTAYGWLWHAYELKGDYAGAYEAFIKYHKRTKPDRVEIFQKAYETAGWQGVGRKRLEFFKLNEDKLESSFFDIARQCALLGEKDQAFDYLNKAVERREWPLIMLNVDPTFDSLRGDPRFAELVRRVGLK